MEAHTDPANPSYITYNGKKYLSPFSGYKLVLRNVKNEAPGQKPGSPLNMESDDFWAQVFSKPGSNNGQP